MTRALAGLPLRPGTVALLERALDRLSELAEREADARQQRDGLRPVRAALATVLEGLGVEAPSGEEEKP